MLLEKAGIVVAEVTMSALQQQHVVRVMRLYRNILKNVENWAVDREVFYVEVQAQTLVRGR